eukprot:1122785_1
MGYPFLLLSISILTGTVIRAQLESNQRPYVERGAHAAFNPASWCDRVLIACRQDGVEVTQREYGSFTMVDSPGIGKSDHDPIYMDLDVAKSGSAGLASASGASVPLGTIRALVISWNVEQHVDYIDDHVANTLLSKLRPDGDEPHDIVFISIQEGGEGDTYEKARNRFKSILEGTPVESAAAGPSSLSGNFEWVSGQTSSEARVNLRKVFGLLWKRKTVEHIAIGEEWGVDKLETTATVARKAIVYSPVISQTYADLRVQFAALHFSFTSYKEKKAKSYAKKLELRENAVEYLLSAAEALGGTLISLGDANFRSESEASHGTWVRGEFQRVSSHSDFDWRTDKYLYNPENDELMAMIQRKKSELAGEEASGSGASEPKTFRGFEPEGIDGTGPKFAPTCKLKKSSSNPDKKDPEKYMTKEEQVEVERAATGRVAVAASEAAGMVASRRGRDRGRDRARAQDFNRYYGQSYYDESNVLDELDDYIYDLAVNELRIDSRLKRLQRERQNILLNKRKQKQNLVHKKRKYKYIN